MALPSSLTKSVTLPCLVVLLCNKIWHAWAWLSVLRASQGKLILAKKNSNSLNMLWKVSLFLKLLVRPRLEFLSCAGDFSPAHIWCQPRNSCKMILPVAQNSSIKAILYSTLYSQPRTYYSHLGKSFIQTTSGRVISRPWNKSPAHHSKFPIWGEAINWNQQRY